MNAPLRQAARVLSRHPIPQFLPTPPLPPSATLRPRILSTSTPSSSPPTTASTASATSDALPPPPRAAAPADAPIPPVVRYLGYGGALPFLAGGLGAALAADAEPFVRATHLYGAAILPFLGGVHWGVALRGPPPATRDFVYSVVPALVAWGAALAPPTQGLPVLAAGFGAALLYDSVRFSGGGGGGGGGVPAWYRRLRWPLTAAAVSGCGTAWLAGGQGGEGKGVRFKDGDAMIVSTAAMRMEGL